MGKTNNAKCYFGVTVQDMDSVTKAIYEGLLNGESKKVLSNRYKVPIRTVQAISKRFCTGQKSVQITPAFRIYEHIPIPQSEPEEIKEEVSNDKELVDNVEEEEVIEEKQSSKRKNVPYSKDEVDAVVELLKDGNTYAAISEVSGMSAATIWSIAKKYGVRKCDRDNKNEKTLTPIISRNIRVGLVADRHKMPVNDYIFKEEISPSMMFDYEKLELHCREYIENMVDFKDGISQQNLVVYLSGLQCASASLVKVCNDMKVNLTFRHYDKQTDSYHSQVIWNQFGITIKECVSELLINSKNSFTYNCSLEELYNVSSLIKITKSYLSDESSEYKECILVKNTNDCIDIIKQLVNEQTCKKFNLHAKGYNLLKGRFIENGFEITMKLN